MFDVLIPDGSPIAKNVINFDSTQGVNEGQHLVMTDEAGVAGPSPFPG